MPYNPPTRFQYVALRSPRKLELAMKKRDLNAAELASLAGTHRQAISGLRRGGKHALEERTARAVERVLRVEHGDLFDYGEE